MNTTRSQTEAARELALSILDELELANAAAAGILMRSKRLARLIRDSDAQLWLSYETSGYPANFVFNTLGTCMKYAASAGRLDLAGSTYFRQSIPELEAEIEHFQATLSTTKNEPKAQVVTDHVAKAATAELQKTFLSWQIDQRKNFATRKALVTSLRAGLHAYVSEVHLSIEFGDVVESIFESARSEIDGFLRLHAPAAVEKLVAISDRMAEDLTESRTAALTSCRRLLMTLADALFPAQEGEWIDSKGKGRKVGVEQYKNRLMAYLSERSSSQGTVEILESELAYLADRLDAIYEKTCKGVHIDVGQQEARLAIIHAYLFIGELARSRVQSDAKT